MSRDSKYFELPNLLVGASIVVGMGLSHLNCYHPELVPIEIQMLQQFFTNNTRVADENQSFCSRYHSALAVHFIEACFSVILASRRGITDFTTQLKWFASTLVFGGGSLYKLYNFEPDSDENF